MKIGFKLLVNKKTDVCYMVNKPLPVQDGLIRHKRDCMFMVLGEQSDQRKTRLDLETVAFSLESVAFSMANHITTPFV